MTDIEQAQQDDSIHHVWNFLWFKCQQVRFGVDVLDLYFWVHVDAIE